MLDLQCQGCHNVNLVSPSHVVPQILAAVRIAARAGLRVPLVYNTGGYDSLETLALLDGVVDIYMPDVKYADPEVGARYSGVPDYPAANRAVARGARPAGARSAPPPAWKAARSKHRCRATPPSGPSNPAAARSSAVTGSVVSSRPGSASVESTGSAFGGALEPQPPRTRRARRIRARRIA